MEEPNKPNHPTNGLHTFARELKQELEKMLEGRAKVNQTRRDDSDNSISLIWDYDTQYAGDIFISVDRRSKETGALMIDYFWRVFPVKPRPLLPSELRAIAQVYDDVSAFIGRKFGAPVYTGDGRTTYRAFLNKTLEKAAPPQPNNI